jgi:C1A family cysteine protease
MDHMNKFFRAVVLAAMAMAPIMAEAAAPDSLSTVIHGRRYATGYLGQRDGGPLGASFWKPTPAEVAVLPDSYDLRDHGLTTPIVNQGSCGSCWSFARTKAHESAWLKAGNVLALDLAEQDTLVNDRSAYGCNGGFMDGRYEVDNGQSLEADCPYRASTRYSCQKPKASQPVSWSMVGANSSTSPTPDDLRAAIYHKGAIAVTVAAGGSFSPNSDGVITGCGSRSINHMVTLVGYRPASSGGYEFLIANSWGTSWGLGGFAWSKQGCNRLASSAGDAALFFEVQPVNPPDPIDCPALYMELSDCLVDAPSAPYNKRQSCSEKYLTFSKCIRQ